MKPLHAFLTDRYFIPCDRIFDVGHLTVEAEFWRRARQAEGPAALAALISERHSPGLFASP
jgi:hypothetical protein